MKKIKLFLLMLIVLLLCGCSAEYNLEITNNTFNESIDITANVSSEYTKQIILDEYNSWIPVYIDEGYPEIPVKINGNHYHNKTINESENGYYISYKFNYPKYDFNKSTILDYAFKAKNIIIDNTSIKINTSNELLIFNEITDLTNINININVNGFIILNHNADKVDGNTLTWSYNRSNYKNKSIHLELNKIRENDSSTPISEPKIEDDSVSNTTIIIILISLSLFIILLFVMIKIKQRKQ